MSQVVLITGASSGFGLASARHLQARGYIVYGTSRRAPLSALEIDTRYEAGFAVLPMNVDDEASVERGVQTVLRREGRIDAVVNNAGWGYAGAVEDTSVEEAKAEFETLFFGPLRVCRAVLPAMRAQKSGKIINIGSLGGRVGVPFQGPYSAAKFALAGLSEALRLEVRPFGIHVVLVEPGDACTGYTDCRRRTKASQTNDAYQAWMEKALAVMEHDERHGLQPVALARLVERILRARNPRQRYVAALPLQAVAVALKPVVPATLFEWALRKMYHLG
ncbi:MAG: SDR family oxidoreductase [Anaerolineae bacterium]